MTCVGPGNETQVLYKAEASWTAECSVQPVSLFPFSLEGHELISLTNMDFMFSFSLV